MKKYGLKNYIGYNSGLLVHGDSGTGKRYIFKKRFFNVCLRVGS